MGSFNLENFKVEVHIRALRCIYVIRCCTQSTQYGTCD